MLGSETVVETDRLILRPFTEDDLDFLDILHGDLHVMRYTLGRVRSHEENIAYLDNLQKLQAEQGIGQRLVIRKSDNRPVGRCGLSEFYGKMQKGIMSYSLTPEYDNMTRTIELGYSFLRPEWGKGYATEAARAMRDYGLYQQGFPLLHSIIVRENTGSVAVARKIGAALSGECLCLGLPGLDFISKNHKDKI